MAAGKIKHSFQENGYSSIIVGIQHYIMYLQGLQPNEHRALDQGRPYKQHDTNGIHSQNKEGISKHGEEKSS